MERIALGTVLALAGTVAAQQVSIAARATTPVVASVVWAGAPYDDVLPAGPLPDQGGVNANAPTIGPAGYPCQAVFGWSVQQATLPPGFASIACGFGGSLDVASGAAGAQAGALELVFDVTASAPRSVWIDIDLTASIFGASQPLTWEVDVGDDGIVDAQVGSGHVRQYRNVGTAPLPIRVRCQAAIGPALPGPGFWASMHGDVTIALTPENRVQVQQTVVGCGALPLLCEAVFEHTGVQLQPVGVGPLAVFVLGLQQQPWVFTNLFGSGCVVMPSLDVLLLSQGPLDVPIPASVRPLTFHAQVVHALPWFGDYALATTEAYRIFAY